MTLRWLASGGRADAVALVGFALHPPARETVPPVPLGTFLVAAERDQFGAAAETRAALPEARVAEVKGVDHYVGGEHALVGRLVADEFARSFRLHSPFP